VLQLLAGGYYGISLCRPFFFLLLDSSLESLPFPDWLEDWAVEEFALFAAGVATA